MTLTSLSVVIDKPVGLMLESAAEAVSPAVAKATLKAANFAGGSIVEEITATFGFSELARTYLPATFIDQGRDTVSAGALSDHVAARILDQGGTIYPKTVKHLAIPLTDKAKNMWPRDWAKGDLFAYKSKAGNLLLGEKTSTGIRNHYVLKDEVTIRPKRYLAKSLERFVRAYGDTFDKEIAAAMEAGMSEGASG